MRHLPLIVHLLVPAILSALTACGDQPPSNPESDDDRGPSGLSLPLVEGRTFEVERWVENEGVEVRQIVREALFAPDADEKTFLSALAEACFWSEHVINGAGLESQNIPVASRAACAAGGSPSKIGVPSAGSILIGGFLPVVQNCVAHWALHLAEATEPLHIASTAAGTSARPIILPHGLGLSEPYKTLLDVASTPEGEARFSQEVRDQLPFLRGWDSFPVKFDFRVRPPSASDRATWALLAVELFRTTALATGNMLRDDECLNGVDGGVGFDLSFETLSGDTLSGKALLAGNFADAVTSSIEAAEVAQKYLAAAAVERRANASDPSQAAIDGWRGRYDSRLEGVGAYALVNEALFERVQPRPLLRTRDYTSPLWLLHTTHAVDIETLSFSGISVEGWVLPPELPGGDELVEIRSFRHNTDQTLFTSTASEIEGATPWRREGWGYRSEQAGTTSLLMELPTDVSATGHVAVHILASPAALDVGLDPKQRYPVVSARTLAPGDEHAEELIRQTGVNPCLQDQRTGGCPAELSQGRTVTMLGDDLLAELKRQSPGAYGGFGGTNEFLDAQFIRSEDLVRAATRIVQSSHALGRPIRSRGTSSLVDGIQHMPHAAHPAYLYAVTAGRPGYARGAWVDRLEAEFSRDSVATLASWAERAANEVIEADTSSDEPAWKANLRQLRGALEQFTEHADLTVVTTVATQQISSLQITRDGLKASNKEELESKCGVWLNEVGLNCALSHEGSAECSEYRFNQPTWSTPTVTAPGYYAATAVVLATDAPPREIDGQVLQRVQAGDRIYVVCKSASQAEPIAALTVAAPDQDGTFTWKHPPFSRAVLDALSKALGPDPKHPEQTAFSCAGVPYDVKIPLENELTEAVEGSDGVESSFAHYLRLARQAAERSDQLGNELVQQGLTMDLRAEEAREELEDLCGGVVNVPSFAQAACEGSETCNVPDLLQSTTATTGDVVGDTDLSGAAQCLGVGSTGEPVWAALGNRELCIWQYFDSRKTPVLPMVCPDPGLPCGKLSRKVLLAPDAPKTCADAFGGGGLENLEDIEAPSANTVYARRIKDLLNMTVTDRTAADDLAVKPDEFSCRSVLARRVPEMLDYVKPAWMNQETLTTAAESIGYEEDAFGTPTLTLRGRPWISFRNADGLRTTLSTGWPYRPHPMLEDDPAIPTEVGGENDEFDADSAVVCDPENVTPPRSLFCGGYSPDTLGQLNRRLKAAVLALKGLTGASFDNVIVATTTSYAKGLLPVQPGMQEDGEVPDWLEGAVPGSTYYIAPDQSAIAYQGTDHSFLSRRHAYRPALVDDRVQTTLDQVGADSVWLPDMLQERGWAPASILWSTRLPTKTHEGEYLGLGQMLRYIDSTGAYSIKSQVNLPRYCPDIPTSLEFCDYGASLGWAPGTCRYPGKYYYGGNVRTSVAPRPFTESEIIQSIGKGDRDHAVAKQLLPYACMSDPIVGARVDHHTVVDALELACAVQELGVTNCSTLLATVPDVDSIEDFAKLSRRMECAARSVQETLDRSYVAEIPGDVVLDLSQSLAVQTFAEHRGLYGQTVAELAGLLLTQRAQGDMVVQALRDVGTIMNKAMVAADALELNIKIDGVESYLGGRELALEKNELVEQMIRSRQAISNAAVACVSTVANTVLAGAGASMTGMAGMGAACGNAGVQIASERQLQQVHANSLEIKEDIFDATEAQLKLRGELTQAELSVLMYQTTLQISQQFDKVHQAMMALQTAQAEVQGVLAKLEMQRNQARRAAAKALLLGSDETGRVYNVNLSMRARMNTLRVRYERARQNAIRMAYMARRAVEQKLGVDLSFMTSDMTLVEAPSKWADKLCASSGINYERIRNGGSDGSSSMSSDKAPEDYDYADGYVGDWVTLLENFVESYSVDKPFQAGTDLAVVSLRDELMNVRESEPLQGWNLLYHTDGKSLCSLKDKNERCLRGWQMTCGGYQSATSSLGESSVFGCAPDALACRSMGEAFPISLTTDDVTSCHAAFADVAPPAEASVSVPPQEGLEFWFRGDSCTLVPGTTDQISSCSNKGRSEPGEGRHLRSYTQGVNLKLLASGIGGQPTLELPAGSPLIQAGRDSVPVEGVTLAVVHRPLSSGQVIYGRGGPSNGSSIAHFQCSAGEAAMPWTSSDRGTRLSAPCGLGPSLPASKGEILVGVAGPHGTDLYVNGERVAWDDLPMTPQQVSWIKVQAVNHGAAQLAEYLTYYRALDSGEIEQLHRYLSDRYGIERRQPVRWLDVDDIERARQEPSGKSPVSGYPIQGWTNTPFYDRAHGSNLTVNGAAPPIVPFSAGHFGLMMNGTTNVHTGRSGARCTRRPGEPSCLPEQSPHDEGTLVIAARLDVDSGVSGLLTSRQRDGTFLVLRADANTGGVLLEHVLTGGGVQATYPSATGAIVPGQPFVATIDFSKVANRTRVIVNGSPVIDVPGLSPDLNDSSSGAGHSPNFFGTLAEFRWYDFHQSDAEIVELHREFGAKYGIEIAGESSSASGPPRMRQVVEVGDGDYWLSWIQPEAEVPARVMVELPNGSSLWINDQGEPDSIDAMAIWPVGEQGDGQPVEANLAPGYVRYYAPIEVEARGKLGIGFLSPDTSQGPASLAGIQLELMLYNESQLPRSYFPTRDTLAANIGTQPDRDGSSFRDRWTHKCEYRCPPDADKQCAANGDASGLPQECFWESNFGISLEEIEKGDLIPQAGFSRGNFNYRFDDVAINVVGTNVKTCGDSSLPSACNGGKFLQYSFRHEGPFRTRNYEGVSVRAALYSGQIEHAKGLVAERYLTNPLSGTDRDLLSEFWRRELRGRPLDGAFKLRIYDTDGIHWESVEDVQLALRYRYWTRLN